jgi:hypothetical protein
MVLHTCQWAFIMLTSINVATCTAVLCCCIVLVAWSGCVLWCLPQLYSYLHKVSVYISRSLC